MQVIPKVRSTPKYGRMDVLHPRTAGAGPSRIVGSNSAERVSCSCQHALNLAGPGFRSDAATNIGK